MRTRKPVCISEGTRSTAKRQYEEQPEGQGATTRNPEVVARGRILPGEALFIPREQASEGEAHAR